MAKVIIIVSGSMGSATSMNVLFVQSAARQPVEAETLHYERSWIGYYPPLGMMSIATCINEWTHHTAHVLDGAILGMDGAVLKRAIRAEHPDVVGLSPVTFTLASALRTARSVKEIDPEISVVVGGPHATLFPSQTVLYDDVDLVVRGDGEKPFLGLLNYLEGNALLKGIPGLMWKSKGMPVVGRPPQPLADLDALPIVDRTLTPWKRYTSVFTERTPCTIATTTRGCPHHCSFCYLPMRYRSMPFRAESPKRMVEEMKSCAELGIKEVIFYDETFTEQRPRILEFCRLLDGAELDLTWDIRTRADRIDRDMLLRMKRLGLRRVQMGAESGTQAGLDRMQKGLTLREVEEGFACVQEAELDSFGYFIIGLPGETREMMLETMRFALRLNPRYASFTVFTPLPDSPEWEALLAEGDTSLKEAWENFVADPTQKFDVPTCNGTLTKEELGEMLDSCYKAFYIRPEFVLRELSAIRTPAQAFRRATTVAKILKSALKAAFARRGIRRGPEDGSPGFAP